MTPAEHYAAAEELIGEAARLRSKLLAFTPEEAEQRQVHLSAAVEVTAEAQVHATLATINPEKLWPQKTITICTCPVLGANALARTSTDPACPIHGETP